MTVSYGLSTKERDVLRRISRKAYLLVGPFSKRAYTPGRGVVTVELLRHPGAIPRDRGGRLEVVSLKAKGYDSDMRPTCQLRLARRGRSGEVEHLLSLLDLLSPGPHEMLTLDQQGPMLRVVGSALDSAVQLFEG